MPKKDFSLRSGLSVSVYKRRGSRNLRLSVNPNGSVRVTIPAWATYKTGLNFASSKEDWLRAQMQPLKTLQPGQTIGKSHYLQFVADASATKVTTKVRQSLIIVKYPLSLPIDAAEVQDKAESACIKALRQQAEELLPGRVASLADRHNCQYSGLRIKRLKSRWGSCDHHKNIVLNLFLMQLPWELIDYVILHELTHTEVFRHGPKFWQALSNKLPDVKHLRHTLRQYHPLLETGVA